jgi:hypothetical protein
MPPKTNPQKLNPLQLRTLSLLQALAALPDAGVREESGEVTITRFPQAHGDHIHLAGVTVAAKDASGLYNEAVWHGLERKKVARADWPHRITLTVAGLQYDTGADGAIFHSAHRTP